jgi:hypothetical protein
VRRHEGRRGRRQRVCHPSALRDRLHSTISGILAQAQQQETNVSKEKTKEGRRASPALPAAPEPEIDHRQRALAPRRPTSCAQATSTNGVRIPQPIVHRPHSVPLSVLASGAGPRGGGASVGGGGESRGCLLESMRCVGLKGRGFCAKVTKLVGVSGRVCVKLSHLSP